MHAWLGEKFPRCCPDHCLLVSLFLERADLIQPETILRDRSCKVASYHVHWTLVSDGFAVLVNKVFEQNLFVIFRIALILIVAFLQSVH